MELSCCVQCKTPDDGQRNFPKYVDFCSKDKFEKLVHLVGFIIRTKCIFIKSFTFTFLSFILFSLIFIAISFHSFD